jgi:hypothetical protein
MADNKPAWQARKKGYSPVMQDLFARFEKP